MRYLCLGYHDMAKWNAMADAERNALVAETKAYEQKLRCSGHFLDGKALQGPENSVTLGFERGAISITDGPFAETKEQLGGVMILQADDLNHAIQLVSQIPCMRVGGHLEIRAINEAL